MSDIRSYDDALARARSALSTPKSVGKLDEKWGEAWVLNEDEHKLLGDAAESAVKAMLDYETAIPKAKTVMDAAKKKLDEAEAKLASTPQNLSRTESYTTKDAKGNTVTRTRTVSYRNPAYDAALSARNSARSAYEAKKAVHDGLLNGQGSFKSALASQVGVTTNALEEWRKVFDTGTVVSNPDDNTQKDVKGMDAVRGYHNVALNNFKQMVKEFGERLLRAISRAASGKGFSLTDVT